jgi:GTPase
MNIPKKTKPSANTRPEQFEINSKSEGSRCGYIAIVGRPNVGKSTLLNKILGQKISITANKPQTTRHKILGVKTKDNVQAIYVDTPGFHLGQKRALNRFMLKAISNGVADVDLIIFVVEKFGWYEGEDMLLENMAKHQVPIILVLNKVDQIKQKNDLLPHIQMLNKKFAFTDIIPISAQKGKNVEQLEAIVAKLLPNKPFEFPEEQITDRSERFLITEIIREKLTRLLGQEIPHQLTVEIEKFSDEEKITKIGAIIYVERPGQKKIVIGDKGEKLKEVGTKARLDIEKLLDKKVFLQLWVKVKSGWSDDERLLTSMGYK